MTAFDMVVMAAGGLLMGIGVWLFTQRKGEGTNHIEALGIKMDVSHPALVLVGLGFMLLIVPRLLPDPAKPNPTQPNFSQVQPSQAQPSQAQPSQAQPNQVQPNQVQPRSPIQETASVPPETTRTLRNPAGRYRLVSYRENGIVYATTGAFEIVALDKTHYQWQSMFQIYNAYGQLTQVMYQGDMHRAGDDWFFRVTHSNNPAWYNQGEVPLRLTMENQQLGLNYVYGGVSVIAIWQP
ncbi:MAG: hypothetical protein WAO71_15755 [Gallionella sp.]